MKIILLGWIFLVSCNNVQPTSNATEQKAETTTVTASEVEETPNVILTPSEEKIEGVKESPKVVEPKVVKKEKVTTQPTPQPKVIENTPVVSKPAITHATWDALLQQYVSNSGVVDYKGLKSEEAKLDAYLDFLSKNVPTSGRKTQMAYWINAYNAFTVKLILKNYPVKSIMDINGGKAWDLKFIKLGGKTYTLNDIEHKILRPTFKDARIHFAVNCAAKSCPPIHNHAWTTANLEATLEQKAKAFINNTKYNQIAAKKVKLSNIFNWYKEDFGDLIAFLNKYADTPINANAKISYIDYNWSLNGE